VRVLVRVRESDHVHVVQAYGVDRVGGAAAEQSAPTTGSPVPV